MARIGIYTMSIKILQLFSFQLLKSLLSFYLAALLLKLRLATKPLLKQIF